jgi:hypothetical protein
VNAEAYEEDGIAVQELCGVWAAVCVAEEVGEGVG